MTSKQKPDQHTNDGSRHTAADTSDVAGRASTPATGRAAPEGERQEPIVAVEKLTKTYEGGVRAVDSVSFGVRPGEVVGLLGPNGAGKTTCLKCLLGLIEPTGGRVEVAGVDARANPEVLHQHVSAMLEGARNVYWRLTVRENLEFFTGISGRRPSTVADRHDELLDRLALSESADQPVRNLSRGMKQKVSLATTLARDVSVAVLDEPTLGLDVESSLELRKELGELAAERNVAIVLSSHDMDTIQDLCDRVIILSNGTIAVDRTVEELLDVLRTQQYEISFSDPSDGGGVDQTTLAAELTDDYNVSEWKQRGENTVATVVLDDSNRLPELTRRVVDAGCRLRRVDTVEPDLEEAFLQITEEERRD